MSAATAFKIIAADEWAAARVAGAYDGSAVDRADGYIHLSTTEQLAETARRHYAGRNDLRLLEVELALLGETVVWEAARGGALFPHIYGSLPTTAVVSEQVMTVSSAGEMTLGAEG